jgi:hypothetical protein
MGSDSGMLFLLAENFYFQPIESVTAAIPLLKKLRFQHTAVRIKIRGRGP